MSGFLSVHAKDLVEGNRLPLLVTPSHPLNPINLKEWLDANRGQVDEWLLEHGGILFRGFGIASADRFHAVATAWSKELMTYKERSSPRTLVQEHIYTSTDYPPDQHIFPHNEHSYASRFPARIAFFCLVPPAAGGETPLVDCRRVLERIPAEVRHRFDDRGGWMYVRSFNDGVGLPWQTVFQTNDRQAVEEYCRQNEIQWTWSVSDRLRTTQVRPVIARHPATGDEIWFNHATFFNVGTLPALLRDGLLQLFGVDNLPNNTYYGDGTPFEPETLAALQDAYTAEQAAFSWERGDVLLLDNMMTAHARNPFQGPRQILVSMADPVEWKALSS